MTAGLISALLWLAASAAASPYFTTPVISTRTGTAWESISGQFYVAASSRTPAVPTVTIDGAEGTVRVSSNIYALNGCIALKNGWACGSGSDFCGYIAREVPVPAPDGLRTDFYLSHTPRVGTETIYVNGLQYDSGDDYSVLLNTVTFTPSAVPMAGFKIRVTYMLPCAP